MTRAPTKVERWSLLLWAAAATVLFAVARPPPQAPAMDAEEIAAIQRGLDKIVTTTRAWQAERGDRRIPWDEAQGHLVIVIDDVGRELHLFDQLLALRYPLTFSVLPASVYAPGVQLRLRADRRRPRDILLHLPMEPIEAAQMTRGDEAQEDFLRVGDSPDVLRTKLERALERVPTAIGINNHMGSRLSAECAAMDAVMPIVRERGLFWLDSRTTAQTCGERSAIAAGVPAIARQVFLDDDPSEDAIATQLARAAELSRTRPVVAIGHPSAAMVEVLGRELPRLHDAGIAVVPLGQVVARQAPPGVGAPVLDDRSGTGAPDDAARAPAGRSPPLSAPLPAPPPPGPNRP